MSSEPIGVEIAIVGLAGRFPGAEDVDAFWRNIVERVESVRFHTDDELRARGVSDSLLNDPAYVKASVAFEGMDRFDARFFGFTPREAEQLDPQHRLFLETAWQALEHAGVDSTRFAGSIGVFAGSGANVYLLRHLLPVADASGTNDIASLLGLVSGNDKDSLATRAAYKLGLRGPAVSVQTACSTSLVAVHLACRALLNHEADLVIAGGVWLNLLQDGGYLHQAGAILSSDGHCRAFDARASGTLIGSGVGVVALKRLAEALADGDTIHAVIKGSALNNDGSAKLGYTAPSVEGQAEAILAAQSFADVSPDSIGYVEAHGTGTTLGDPVEIAALTQAFRTGTARRGFCAIGSVKTNIGHLDAAAGVAGLIKTVMALKHRTLPPSLHFERPNPQIDFASSPFYVNTEAKPWPAGPLPRRAGVSAFGMGGTNVHVIVEEGPEPPSAREESGAQLLMLSARSVNALRESVHRLAAHLEADPRQSLADAAHTLRVGRRRFGHRAVVLANDVKHAVDVLSSQPAAEFFAGQALSERPSVAFLFPGQGAQHVGMARELYERETAFRDVLDRCCDQLQPRLGLDLWRLLHPAAGDEAVAASRLAQTAITQPALFAVEYAVAQLWLGWGVRPDAMLGHSIGEYVAACLAGVFTLDEGLTLVAERGRLLQSLPPGAMLAVGLPETELTEALQAGCDLAAVNGEGLCVLSGPDGAISDAEQRLAARGAAVRRLHVSHAFHSTMVEPVLKDFEAALRGIELRPPRIPFVSNLSGRWIADVEATDHGYWLRHLRGTVRFADGLTTLCEKPDRVLLEVGPGETLGTLARRHLAAKGGRPVLSSQCHPDRASHQALQPQRCLAQLWVSGIEPDDKAFGDAQGRRRVPLPTYPFERQSYWVPAAEPGQGGVAGRPDTNVDDLALYEPSWQRVPPLTAARKAEGGCTLVYSQRHGLAQRLVERLQEVGARPVLVECAVAFERCDAKHYRLRPDEREDHERLLKSMQAEQGRVRRIVHLWSLGAPTAETQRRGFFSLLALAQALDASSGREPTSLAVVTQGVEDVTGLEAPNAENAMLSSSCRVLPQEVAQLDCRSIDVLLPPPDSAAERRLAAQVVDELCASADAPRVALRGAQRWLPSFERLRDDEPAVPRLRRGGVYLITGGLGGIGLALAGHLARQWDARLALVGRTSLPPREQWAALAIDRTLPAALRARLQALCKLQEQGAEMLLLQADVTDAAQLRSAIDATRERFGTIHGVVHAAGEAGSGLIAQQTRGSIESAWAAKVQGTQLLLDALRDERPDFVFLCSSLASLAGGLGKLGYAAANAYLDAVACASRHGDGPPVFSANWDGWREVGMAAGLRLPEHLGLSVEQGLRAFERIVNGPVRPQTVVTRGELVQRLAQREEVSLDAMPEPAQVHSRDARPALATPFAAPESDLEQALAALWSEFLGIAPIGVHDNLFELGADSLLAIQLLARVRARYAVELHPAEFFKQPTVGAMAVAVELRLIEQIQGATHA